MKLNFKFVTKAPKTDRTHLIDTLGEYGVKKVEQLFENDPDPELGAMFFLECDDEESLEQAAKLLEEAEEVEYAEIESVRKLIR